MRAGAATHHLVQALKSMPVWACAQRMAVRTSTCGSPLGSRPSREGDHSPPTSTASSSFRPSKNLICFRGCSGVSLGSAMSSTKSMQQRYSSSSPGEESSRTCAGQGSVKETLDSLLSLQPWAKVARPQPNHLGTVSRVTVRGGGLSSSVWSWLLLRRCLDAAWMVEGKGLAQREGRQPAQMHGQKT